MCVRVPSSTVWKRPTGQDSAGLKRMRVLHHQDQSLHADTHMAAGLRAEYLMRTCAQAEDIRVLSHYVTHLKVFYLHNNLPETCNFSREELIGGNRPDLAVILELPSVQVIHGDKHAIKNFDRELKVEVCPDEPFCRIVHCFHDVQSWADLKTGFCLLHIEQVQDKAKAAAIEAVIPPRCRTFHLNMRWPAPLALGTVTYAWQDDRAIP